MNENSPIDPIIETPAGIGKIDHLSTNEKLERLNASLASRFTPPKVVDQEPEEPQDDSHTEPEVGMGTVRVETVEEKDKITEHLKKALESYDETVVNRSTDDRIGTMRVGRSTPKFDISKETVIPSTSPEEKVEEESTSETIPDWKQGEEWSKFERLRKAVASAEAAAKGEKREFRGEENIGLEEYKNLREVIAQKIRESLMKNGGENLTPEQQAELNSKINNEIFKELVEKENEEYIRIFKEKNKKGLLDRGLENVKDVLDSKVFKWYLGLSKNQRRALSFTLGGMVGLAAGAAVAPGMAGVATYLGWRAIRFGVSGFFGSKASEWANKKWSLEDLEAEKNKAIEDLKNTDLSLDEKSKGLTDIEANFKKAKIMLSAKRIGSTIAAGAGAGMLTGLAEGLTTGVNASANVTETTPKSVNEEVFKPLVFNKPVTEDGYNTNVESLFNDKTVLTREVKSGDSTWKILGNAIEKSKLFEKITGDPKIIEAKKDFILSNLINENNLANSGPLKVGDKVDFTKVFDNKEKIEKLFEKAENISNENIINIWTNNEKIEAWLTDPANKGKPLTPDVVKEILKQKVEPKTFAFNQKPIQTEPPKIILDETIKQAGLEEPKLEGAIAELSAQNSDSVGGESGDLDSSEEAQLVQNLKTQIEDTDKEEAGILDGIESRGKKINELREMTQRLMSESIAAEKSGKKELSEEIFNKYLVLSKEVEIINHKMRYEHMSLSEADEQMDELEKLSAHVLASSKRERLQDPSDTSFERDIEKLKKHQEAYGRMRARIEGLEESGKTLTQEEKDFLERVKERQLETNQTKSEIKGYIKSGVIPPEIAQNEVGVAAGEGDAVSLSNVSTEKVTNIEDYRNKGIRTMAGDSKKLVAEIVSNEKIEEHLRADVNNIYGKKGIFGIGKVEGINTPEWKEISEQNAAKVLGFYAKPENSDLPKKIIEKLTVSREDRDLVEYIDGLRNEAKSAASGFLGMAGSDVSPYNNETVGEYLRRLGKFIMEHPKVEIPNSVSGMRRAA